MPAHRRLRGVVGRVERRDRRGVHDRRHPVEPAANGLEHVDRSEDVDARPERRVGPAEGHLQRGEVDHVRDPVLVERALDRLEIGDVAGHVRDRLDLLGREQERDPARVGREVEGDDALARPTSS